MNDATPSPEVQGPVFLVVDDDPLIVHALAKALRPLGKVAYSTDFDQVHVMAALTMPRIMLIDIDLPQVTGFEIVRRIRANPDLDGSHVFLMTAHRGEAVLREAANLAIDGLLQKPIDFKSLLERAERLISGPKRGN